MFSLSLRVNKQDIIINKQNSRKWGCLPLLSSAFLFRFGDFKDKKAEEEEEEEENRRSREEEKRDCLLQGRCPQGGGKEAAEVSLETSKQHSQKGDTPD